MKVYSYVVTHDYGFAPNPFGGVLTLATCKPKIRKNAKIGDWIMGTGSAGGISNGRLIFAGEVAEILTIEAYGASNKYKFKVAGNSPEKWRRRGDNIYYLGSDSEWVQRKNPFHGPNEQSHDLSGKNVLVCREFWYFGASAPLLPSEFMSLVKKGPAHKHNQDNPHVPKFLSWLKAQRSGLIGQPSSIKA